MITRRTKIQLLVFVIITLVGVTFVGARYARLDRVVRDDAYTVVAHFSDSGGIFAGGEVTYRGVGIGKVEKLELTDEGVDVYLDIENSWDAIPADSLAVVGNRSAVGEQYVELQPNRDTKPFLENDSEIDQVDTRTPLQTEKLLTDISDTVSSVDQDSLRTVVEEFGAAFGGTGRDLQRIIDTGNSFLDAADQNFPVTQALIKDGNTVLQGQVASEGALRTFARELALFSETLAGSDEDVRQIIDTGSFTANQLRTFLEQNRVDLGELINNLVTTGELVTQYLPSIQQILVIYPYIVEGGFTVADDSVSGLYDAHFGLIVTDNKPCYAGYTPRSDQRSPLERFGNREMNTDARCTEKPGVSSERGAQNAPRPAPGYDAPEIGTYDRATGTMSWDGTGEPALERTGTVAPRSLGEESWKWLYLQPLMSKQG